MTKNEIGRLVSDKVEDARADVIAEETKKKKKKAKKDTGKK